MDVCYNFDMRIQLQDPQQTSLVVTFSTKICVTPSCVYDFYIEYPKFAVDCSLNNVGYVDSNYAIGSILSDKLGALLYPHSVSRLLYHNLPEISKILTGKSKKSLKNIYHLLKQSSLAGRPSIRRENPHSKRASGQYFTLGLDSFYTLLCMKKQPKYLIYIEGYDVELERKPLLREIHKVINVVADKIGSEPIFIRTNLRNVSDKFVTWEQFHGIACASVMYCLYPLLDEVYSNNGKTLDPIGSRWGSGKYIDSLCSTEYVRIKSFGHDKNRFEKALELSKSKNFDLVLKYVRPCWKNQDKGDKDFNCCKCEKCARTYLSLVAATGITDIEAFRNFSVSNLDSIDFHHNLASVLAWPAIYKNLIMRFGSNAEIVKKSKRFTILSS